MLKGIVQRVYDYFHDEPDPALELRYFDMKGLAQSCRDVMEDTGIAYNDTRVHKDHFSGMKETLPFKQLPVLVVNEEELIAQSKTILRYVGAIGKVHPTKDLLNAASVDQWLELHTEFMFPLFLSMMPGKYGLELTDAQKAHHRAWCINVHIPKYFGYVEKQLADNEYICTDDKSSADYAWLPTFEWIYSGKLDGTGPVVYEHFPEIRSFMSRNDINLHGEKIGDAAASDDVNSVD